MNALRFNVLFAAAGLLLATAGCSTKPEIVPSSGPRPPTTMDQVKLYQNEPAKYEQLGTVTEYIAPNAKWDESGNAAGAGYDRLRAKAAALGGNGLVFVADKGVYSHLITAGYRGTMFQVPYSPNTRIVAAQAVYVVKE